jgi:hypothetical protein
MSLILYTRPNCPLCDEARDVLRVALTGTGVVVEEVDIEDDEALEARYGWLIPVVRRTDSGAECRWPFGPADVRHLLGVD